MVAVPCQAVYLNPDGVGQALIYPYYTAHSAQGNPFNTLLSVANDTSDVKVVRVTFREGRNSRAVLAFNLYLRPRDMWTGAVIPHASGAARLATLDRTCTSPGFASEVAGEMPGRTFQTGAFSGANADSFGQGLDRTREGFVEMLEMATITGTSAALERAPDCVALETSAYFTPDLRPPSGGLSGTLTLINVANGMDFTVNAVALANLTTRSFHRLPEDDSAGFNAPEIDPVSIVHANGRVYRSTWSRPVDAVSAVLMSTQMIGEYVLEASTRSRTDFVITFPTQQFYGNAPPFSAPPFGFYFMTLLDREERGAVFACEGVPAQCLLPRLGRTTSVVTLAATTGAVLADPPALGSRNAAEFGLGGILGVNGFFRNGWLAIEAFSPDGVTSLPNSIRTSLASGMSVTEAHKLAGLPVVGFWVRTFENGTLACSSDACQGNYGGAFPFRLRRSIAPSP